MISNIKEYLQQNLRLKIEHTVYGLEVSLLVESDVIDTILIPVDEEVEYDN